MFCAPSQLHNDESIRKIAKILKFKDRENTYIDKMSVEGIISARILPVFDGLSAGDEEYERLRAEEKRLLGECRARITGEQFGFSEFLRKFITETRADLRLARAWHNPWALPGILLWRLTETYAYFCGCRAAQAKGNISC